MGFHSNLTVSKGIHIIQAFEFASVAAMTASAAFTNADVGKAVMVTGTSAFYLVSGVSSSGMASFSSEVGGTGAPASATYVTMTQNGTLTNERNLVAGDAIDLIDGGANAAVTARFFLSGQVQGDVVYRGSSGWARLGAGTSGQQLTTQGASQDPIWADPGAPSDGTYVTMSLSSGLSNERTLANGAGVTFQDGGANAALTVKMGFAGQAQGDLAYFNGTDWARLVAGVSGQYLTTRGSGQNPVWGAQVRRDGKVCPQIAASTVYDYWEPPIHTGMTAALLAVGLVPINGLTTSILGNYTFQCHKITWNGTPTAETLTDGIYSLEGLTNKTLTTLVPGTSQLISTAATLTFTPGQSLRMGAVSDNADLAGGTGILMYPIWQV